MKTFEMILHCRVCEVIIHREATVRDIDYHKTMLGPNFQTLKCPRGCEDDKGSRLVTQIKLIPKD